MALRGLAVWCGYLLLGVFAWLPCQGHAQVVASDDERGRTHFEAGASYYQSGRYSEAAHEFNEAFQLSGRPEMLLNVSRAHEKAGEVHEAVLALELLLERFPQTSYRPEAETALARLRLLDVPPAATPAPPPAVTPAAEPPAAPLPESRGIWPPRTHTLVLGSTALLTGVVSLAVGVRAHRIHDGLEQRCESDLCSPDERNELERGQRLGRTSTGLSFAALALASATAVLWVLDVRRERATTRLSLGVEPGGLQAHLRWEL